MLRCCISVVYLTCTMGLGTVSVCLTVLVLNLHHRDAECPVPRWASVLVLEYLASLLRVRARKPKTAAGRRRRLLLRSPDGATTVRSGLRQVVRNVGLMRPTAVLSNGVPNRQKDSSATDSSTGTLVDSHGNRREDAGGTDQASDWKEVAHVLDRLFFWLVFLFMTASAMIILLVPLYKEDLSEAT